MPVFMDRQHLLPGQAAQVKAILLRRQLELAAKRRQLHIAVGDDCLVLENDIDLFLSAADRRQGSPAQTMDDCRLTCCAWGSRPAWGK